MGVGRLRKRGPSMTLTGEVGDKWWSSRAAHFVCLSPSQLETLLIMAVTFSLLYTCSSNEECSANTGKCSCAIGYKWDKETNGCKDINECQRKKLNLCPASAICVNTEGSYMCKIKGNGNPCDQSPCNELQYCKNLNHSGSFICSCQQGYKYNGHACVALTGCGKCGVSYTVVNENETLRSIAAFCGLKVTTLMRINPIYGRGSVIKKGETLNISCSERDYLDCGPCGVRLVLENNQNSTSVSGKCGIDELYMGFSDDIDSGPIEIPCGLSQIPKVLQCGRCGAFVHLFDGPAALQDVSTSCDVNIDQIRALNPFLDEMVANDTKLYLPCMNLAADCGPCGSAYKIQSGDIIAIIARRCNVSTRTIAQANPQVDDVTVIVPGQLLNIPCGVSLSVPSSARRPLLLQHWLSTTVICWSFLTLIWWSPTISSLQSFFGVGSGSFKTRAFTDL